jgi:hypothetical protein
MKSSKKSEENQIDHVLAKIAWAKLLRTDNTFCRGDRRAVRA